MIWKYSIHFNKTIKSTNFAPSQMCLKKHLNFRAWGVSNCPVLTHPQFTNGRFESSRIWTNAFWWFNEWFEKRIKRINNSKKIKINPIQLKMCITDYKRKSFRESAKKGNFLLRFLSWSFCYNKSHDIHIILFNSWFCGQISPILSSKQVI